MEENTSPEQLNPASVAKSPDWSHWENLSTVSLREALQLSLELDPNTHVPATEPDMLLREKFWERLMVAKNHAISAKWIVGKAVREDGDINFELTMVDLKKFAHWVVTETTLKPIAVEFGKLAEIKSTGLSPAPLNEPKSWTQRSAQEFIDEKRMAGSFEAASMIYGVSRQRYTEVYKGALKRDNQEDS